MISAYILTNIKPGSNLFDTMEQMQEIQKLKCISVVSGTYDMMILTNVNDLDELFEVTQKIQRHPQIIKTSTQVIERDISTKNN